MRHGIAERRNHAMVSVSVEIVNALGSSTIVTIITNEDIGFPSSDSRKTLKSSSEWLPGEPQNQ